MKWAEADIEQLTLHLRVRKFYAFHVCENCMKTHATFEPIAGDSQIETISCVAYRWFRASNGEAYKPDHCSPW